MGGGVSLLKYYFIRVHENLVQHPIIIISNMVINNVFKIVITLATTKFNALTFRSTTHTLTHTDTHTHTNTHTHTQKIDTYVILV